MRVNLPEDLTKYSREELEKMLHEVSLGTRPLVEELSKRYQQIKQEQENLKKAS